MGRRSTSEVWHRLRLRMRDALGRTRPVIPDAATPGIVVGGFYRSGTTLLRRMLNAHPRIFCGPEAKFWRDYHGDFRNDALAHLRFFRTVRQLEPEAGFLLDAWGGAWIATLAHAAARHGKARWADKNPENALYVDSWDRLLGARMRFVHCVRHPLDVLASAQEADFPATLPQSFEDKVALYRRFVETALAYERRHPERSARLRYEDLVRDPPTALAPIMRLVGEDFDPAMLRFATAHQGRGLEDRKIDATDGVHDRSVGRYAQVLNPAQVRHVVTTCADLFTTLAYEIPDASG